MRIAADIKTAVGALVLSLMFVRCDQGELGLTTPWGLRPVDVAAAAATIDGWSDTVSSKTNDIFGTKND